MPSAAHAASRNTQSFQKEWDASKPDLKTSGSKAAKPDQTDAQEAKDSKPKKIKRKRRGSSTPPERVEGDNARRSQRDVCRSQCSLERMSCDQGRDSFQNRTDQLRAAQSSCYLAVQGCLSRC